MKQKIVAFLKDENGQTSTEYILLVAVVAIVIYKFKGIMVEKLTGLTEGVFGKAEGLVEEMN
jgi:pilus assembly protein Flp/PilA